MKNKIKSSIADKIKPLIASVIILFIFLLVIFFLIGAQQAQIDGLIDNQNRLVNIDEIQNEILNTHNQMFNDIFYQINNEGT